MAALGTHPIGVGGISGAPTYVQPTVALSAPAGQFSTSPLTATWTYTGMAGYPQVRYRIEMWNEEQTVLLADKEADSAAVTDSFDYAFSPYSTYTIVVSVFDGVSWSEPVSASSTYIGGTSTPDANPQVGSVYEVGINGNGFMLRDHPERQIRYERRSAGIDTPRLATGATPFSEGFDRYVMIGQTDFSSGAGQRFRDRERSVPNAYWRSTGVNPFDVGELQLLPATETYASPGGSQAVVASDTLYVLSDTAELTAIVAGSGSAFTIAAAGTITNIESDGINWYACDGANIFRSASAADPGSAWSSIDATLLRWCGDRLVCAYATSPSTTANTVSVLADAGTEVGSPQKWTLPDDTEVVSITHGTGFIWWAANKSDRAFIYGWKVGSTDSYFTALDLPTGAAVNSIGYYQGVVYTETVAPDGTHTILRCAVAADGLLVPAVLTEFNNSYTDPITFLGVGDKVLFSWAEMEGAVGGVGAIDLATGGWSKWLVGSGDASAGSVVSFEGRVMFLNDGVVHAEDIDSNWDVTYRSSGVLDTSIADLATGLRKVLDTVTVITDPLPVGTSVSLDVTLDGGLSYRTVGSVSAAGTTAASFPLGYQTDSMGLRFTLTSDGTATPVVRTVSVKTHPVGLADRLLVLPINCADQVAGLNGRTIVESGKGSGAARARFLESLMQQTVYVQDVDWPVTRVVGVYEVVSVEVQSVGMFDKAVNRQTQDMTAIVTLRGQL